jgi:predicted Holliday junction resolvase-like endonuclease
MKRALLVLVIILLMAGFVRGWFALTAPRREPETRKVDVKFSVDPDKMKEDAERVKEKAEKFEEKAEEKLREATQPSNQGV